jgi:putative zinc finger/helix-turn-helix YgiT family protein
MDYTAKVKQDGVVHEIHLPQIEIPRCQTCGETVITTAVDERLNEALREQLRLLTPDQIRQNIEDIDLTQKQFAERLGVAAETISRWVNGALIQTRAMDNLLRVYFAVPKVRDVLQGAEQDPALGTVVLEEDNAWDPRLVAAAAPARLEVVFRSLKVRELAKQATSPRWNPFALTDN